MAIDYGKRRKRLGDLLIAAGVITQGELQKALDEQRIKGIKLGEALIELGYVTESDITETLKSQLGLESESLNKIHIEDKVISLLNESIVKKHTLIPIGFKKNDPNILLVAMENPLDFIAIDDISIITNLQVEPVIASSSEIKIAIDKYYGKAATMAVVERYNKENEQKKQLIIDTEKDDLAINDDIDNSPIVLLVKSIIEQAVRQRASDIHIEPMDRIVRVRYRIDGTLVETMTYDISLLSAIVARIKIIGEMDISEKRKPQDGRFSALVDKKEYDARVSILPTVFGEKIVLRIFAKRGLTKPKSSLGFRKNELEKFDKILSNPNGIILVTGPTGSGKSTTLYTAISELNKSDVNIITVEDPVEANIEGINQVQVNVKADLTFASALRSILRQDPDIIMIGEIRDSETAEIAIKASITGHLVVSTLHTNNTASSIARLIDMGIEPYLIADAAVGIIAQRLVRKLCECKKSRKAEFHEKKLLDVDEDKELTLYEPVGCEVCNNTGYFGRTGIYEIMPVTNAIKRLIVKGESSDKINKQALEEGMDTLRMSASKYVIEGVISLEEMKRITFE